MSKAGEKRTLDGGNDEGVEFTDAQLTALEEQGQVAKRVDFATEVFKAKLAAATFPKRDEVLDATPKFWITALQNSVTFLRTGVLEEDRKAMQFLTKIRAWRDPGHPQAFGYEFHFDSNPFFTNSSLKKEYKYVAPSDPEALKKDENGVSQADIDFDFERDTDIITTKIDWKEGKNLTKQYPQVFDPENPDDLEDTGSFFNFFETSKLITLDMESDFLAVYEDAVDFFFNRAEGTIGADMMGSDDEDDEDADDSDASEIDLEAPKKKARK